MVHDALCDCGRFRVLVVIEEMEHECLALEVDISLMGERVSKVLERWCDWRGAPLITQSDRRRFPGYQRGNFENVSIFGSLSGSQLPPTLPA